MKYLKLFLLFSITFFQCSSLSAQISIEETIQYINKMLEGNPDAFRIDFRSADYNAIYGISKVEYIESYTIINYVCLYGCMYSQASGILKFNTNDLDIYETTEKYSFTVTYINFSCKNNSSNCIKIGSRAIGFFSVSCGSQSTRFINAFINIKKLTEISNPVPVKNDPFASKSDYENSKYSTDKTSTSLNITNDNNYCVVNMILTEGGTYEIPVLINNVLTINFIYDSGASDVSISPDVALTLIRTGTIKSDDFIGSQKYIFADGSIAESKKFILRNMKIGKFEIKNVTASISNSINSPILLGQSALGRFKKVTVNNINHTLTIYK